eukprot:gene1939-1447_t
MGGCSSDEDVYSRDIITTNSKTGYSNVANDLLSQNKKLHKSCDPTQYTETNTKIYCTHKSPIIFALDVTGSMGDWTKVIYDKLPMFYGQIVHKKYVREILKITYQLDDPAVSFCAIGDVKSDDAPFQVTDFGQGKQIDELISKIYLEGGGGGNSIESYDLAGYFINNFMDMTQSKIPFIFFTGDEGLYTTLKKKHLKEYFNINEKDQSVEEIFSELTKNYNVFHLHKPYWDEKADEKIKQQWGEHIGEENVLVFESAKACVDVMLGAIALKSGSRTLEKYIKDMEDRGQERERIEEVTKSLTNLSLKLSGKLIKVISSKNDVPEEFICPITKEIMEDPVIMEDGNTYERFAIHKYLKENSTSPITKEKIISMKLTPNHTLRKLIQNYKEKYDL